MPVDVSEGVVGKGFKITIILRIQEASKEAGGDASQNEKEGKKSSGTKHSRKKVIRQVDDQIDE